MPKQTLFALFLLCLTACSFAQERPQPTLVGTWIFKMEGDETVQRVKIVAVANEYQGKVYGQSFTTALKDDRFSFRVGNFDWSGTVQGDQIAGDIVVNGNRSKWAARRIPLGATSQNYEYAPPKNSYSRYFTSGNKLVLRLNAGDVVRTHTIDASGTDLNSKRVSPGGNPLTGPFYIENTVPGDVLVVKLNKVRTNRSWAFSGRALMDNVLDAAYLRDRKFENIDNAWLIEKEKGIVRLQNPPEKLRNFTVPLAPFLGCIGVAPPDGASLRSRDSGSFGGNMECRYVSEGATIYLPVFEEGAYLFLGDGHANQGDGELTGDALETSLDVEFSVDILEAKFYSNPRIENEEFLISVGVGGSLENATRQATTNMARWLEGRYNFTSSESAMVLGFANKYEVADMVMPYLTVLSLVPKKGITPISTK